MKRRIIEIDEKKCNGCGLCVDACHEGAIVLENGKAKLWREDYCDGLGDCLPNCPMNAISFIEKEAPAYDEAAVKKHLAQRGKAFSACPGSAVKNLAPVDAKTDGVSMPSQLRQWPVQIKLVPLVADYYDNADLLIAADCSAFSYGNFHNDFMKGRITLIGCPKLDAVDYAEKLAQIIAQNDIKSILLVRMQVPCCGGLENAIIRALSAAGKDLPFKTVTLNSEGKII